MTWISNTLLAVVSKNHTTRFLLKNSVLTKTKNNNNDPYEIRNNFRWPYNKNVYIPINEEKQLTPNAATMAMYAIYSNSVFFTNFDYSIAVVQNTITRVNIKVINLIV